ncbi:alpha/beta hydrolase [Sphingomonas sp.]|uniref:alpha/beta hydrolase n=1 Tax=Sphingomonas sp. TaxID=28214 RepID=UPI002C4BCDF6|nr:alpha/beta hydrolase [Sphingomonas sp.]HWK36585.1 alpha/beta hydrolase [Sphingomonas sp.]
MTAHLTWPDLTRRPRPDPDATVTYGPDSMHRVDVWRPDGAGPFPTVLMVHGGCWTTAIADRKLMNWVADDLRRHGIAVWNIDYRGVDRAGGGYPGTFADAALAADRLATDAAAFGLDPRRLVAVGHSAGAHLALWLAARHRLPAGSALATTDPLRIDHVVSLGGLPDLEATAARPDNGCGTDVIGRLVGRPGPGRADVYADTSIPRLLPLGVSQDVVGGVQDRIVPADMVRDYATRATAAGDAVRLTMIENTGHVELVTPDSAAWSHTRALIRAALGNAR